MFSVWYNPFTIFFSSNIFTFWFCTWWSVLLFFKYFLMWIYFIVALFALLTFKWNLDLYWESIWKYGKYLSFLQKTKLFLKTDIYSFVLCCGDIEKLNDLHKMLNTLHEKLSYDGNWGNICFLDFKITVWKQLFIVNLLTVTYIWKHHLFIRNLLKMA